MIYKKMKRGWRGESYRHSQARKGIKTSNKTEAVMKVPLKKKKKKAKQKRQDDVWGLI